ncbi:MAG: flavohemoglobin expression-modulating QEGLA motif protein [Gammaproteobacteria bacterium]|nr:flavohemoglobin expression-modulating QEGLA motif protein [Gammaproteobacteria bacterium]
MSAAADDPAKKPVSLGLRSQAISPHFVASALRRLEQGKPLQRRIQPWGRIHIERQLPFLVVYRRPPKRDDPNTYRLVLGEASYLLAPGDRKHHRVVAELVRGIAAICTTEYGAFLMIEVWASDDTVASDAVKEVPGRAGFKILRPKRCRLDSTVDVLDWSLDQVRVKGNQAEIEVESVANVCPPSHLPLLTSAQVKEQPWHALGLEVRPVFRASPAGQDFPLVRRVLHRGMARALKRAVFDFTRRRTSQRPAHYQALGHRRIVNAVWSVDRLLAQVSNKFDFLLQVTPVNADQAWNSFRRHRFDLVPEFMSRPLPIDPALMKRSLFKAPIERIEDPTLAQLFLDQQMELDRKLTMLGDRGTPQFLYGSLALYGGVEEALLALAYDILDSVSARTRDESPRGAVAALEFARIAEGVIQEYRTTYPDLNARVEVRPDLTGLMVSRGALLIGSRVKVPKTRVDALLAHEVGTHLVTYVNGLAQPFRQLHIGLPGYEELQEGLAVVAEYLVGGLSRPRLRMLAARVLAIHMMVNEADFVEVFRELVKVHHFGQRTAFNIAMRVFRGGGLTKDAVYLRGLFELLEHIRSGGELEPLIVGKFALKHLPVIEELNMRSVLNPPPLRPTYLDNPSAVQRLEEIKHCTSIINLVKRRTR